MGSSSQQGVAIGTSRDLTLSISYYVWEMKKINERVKKKSQQGIETLHCCIPENGFGKRGGVCVCGGSHKWQQLQSRRATAQHM